MKLCVYEATALPPTFISVNKSTLYQILNIPFINIAHDLAAMWHAEMDEPQMQLKIKLYKCGCYVYLPPDASNKLL